MSDFGYKLAEEVKVHVWDTSAEQRYLVIPQRPENTDDLTEEQLVELVTRDSMIGTTGALTREEWESRK